MQKYACDFKKSKGRMYSEKESKTRNLFQRDRDRIIHSQSFRRLEYKTQVFVNHESDHFRTRLTHSLEVAQIGRAISSNLGLDTDLTEAISLAHDIGHPAFGHAGEDALKIEMAEYGGFDHNAQALKILTKLEDPYASFDGLNLSFETLSGIVKHNGPIEINDKTPEYIVSFNKKYDLDLAHYASLESSVAAISDDIAYNNHDIDDGIRSGIICLEDLFSVDFIYDAWKFIDKKYPNVKYNKKLQETRRVIYSALVKDVIRQTEENIKGFSIESYEDIMKVNKPLVAFSVAMEEQVAKLKSILMAKLYRHPQIYKMRNKAYTVIKDLFVFYMENEKCLDFDKQEELSFCKGKKEKAKYICDYISGMTDRFAIRHHQEVFDLYNLKPSVV